MVGDTFPFGCAWADRIVLREYFAGNPDPQAPEYQTRCGIYQENSGLDQVMLSWGHDEYLYRVTKDYLPPEGRYMIRYHSFYPAHREGEYGWLMNDTDRKMFEWVRAFNPFDLYSKGHRKPDAARLRPYYENLIVEYFPARLRW